MVALRALFALSCLYVVSADNLVGGYRKKDANDPEYLELAKIALAKKNAELNSNRFIAKIHSVYLQVVAGTNTIYKMDVCDKEGSEYKNCSLCTMKVFRGLKPDHVEVTMFECQPPSSVDAKA